MSDHGARGIGGFAENDRGGMSGEVIPEERAAEGIVGEEPAREDDGKGMIGARRASLSIESREQPARVCGKGGHLLREDLPRALPDLFGGAVPLRERRDPGGKRGKIPLRSMHRKGDQRAGRAGCKEGDLRGERVTPESEEFLRVTVPAFVEEGEKAADGIPADGKRASAVAEEVAPAARTPEPHVMFLTEDGGSGPADDDHARLVGVEIRVEGEKRIVHPRSVRRKRCKTFVQQNHGRRVRFQGGESRRAEGEVKTGTSRHGFRRFAAAGHTVEDRSDGIPGGIGEVAGACEGLGIRERGEIVGAVGERACFGAAGIDGDEIIGSHIE